MKAYLVAIVFIATFAGTNALDCYQCLWIEGDNVTLGNLTQGEPLPGTDLKLHKSCNAKKPDASLVAKCGPSTHSSGAKPTCGKYFERIRGKDEAGKSFEAQIVMKGCTNNAFPNLGFENGCQGESLNEFVNKFPNKEIKDALNAGLPDSGLDGRSKGSICLCSGDRCNGATSMMTMAVSSTGAIVVASISVFLKLIA